MPNTQRTAGELKALQALPLSEKIQISMARISEWYRYFNGNVYIAYSGGKDSRVLLHLVRRLYPEVPALFVNTGLEYPEIQKLAKETENTTVIRPSIMFNDVIKQYGYPLISKEVSEAIYYARRINGGGQNSSQKATGTVWGTGGLQTVNKRTELVGDRTSRTRTIIRNAAKNSWECGQCIPPPRRNANPAKMPTGTCSCGERGCL